jgi:integrase
MPKIFEPKDLKAFFASLNSDYDRLLFDLLLTTGLTEREAMHLEWVDLNIVRMTLQVRCNAIFASPEGLEVQQRVNSIKWR